MIKECQATYTCRNRSKRWIDNQNKFQETNDKRFDKFLGIIEREGVENTLDYSSHALYRMQERLLISKEEINEILDLGWVVEGRPNGELIILVYFKRNSRMFPLHIVITPESDYYVIKTVYNPLKEIWSDDLSTKICFCGNKRFGNNI